MLNGLPPLPDCGTLYDEAPCGLVLTDTSGVILKVNATFCRWIGYPPEELAGQRKLQELLTMGGRIYHQMHWAPMMQMQRRIAEVQLDIRHQGGHAIPMLFNAVRRTHGTATYDEVAIFIATDRRQYEMELQLARQQAEALAHDKRHAEDRLTELNGQLVAADRRKDEFLATLAHELRNPLAPMRNVLEVLKQKASEDAQMLWAREVLQRQVMHMTHLVDDLMESSRITQGRVVLRRESVDLRLLAAHSVAASEAQMRAAGHQLHQALPAQPLVVSADATRVTQILCNLLNNAVKYTPPGGQVWLEVAACGEQALVSIRDTGIGIAADKLPRVFDMFAQLEPALERAQGGLGIGLALARGLAQLHGGTVSASSAGPGRGSEFVLRLPMPAAGEVAETVAPDIALAPDGAETEAAKRRVLVIDDNQDAADSLRMALEFLGHEVQAAYDGEGGLALAASFDPQLVLLDIGLPDINGYVVARRIRAQPGGTRVLLVAATGWGQLEDKRLAMEAGFDRHLTKPVDFMDLDSLLRTELRENEGP
jgi:PAS domain S-box-containing protein